MRGSHGLSARRARRTKSRGPKGLQLEVGARRAPRLLVYICNRPSSVQELLSELTKIDLFICKKLVVLALVSFTLKSLHSSGSSASWHLQLWMVMVSFLWLGESKRSTDPPSSKFCKPGRLDPDRAIPGAWTPESRWRWCQITEPVVVWDHMRKIMTLCTSCLNSGEKLSIDIMGFGLAH